MTGKRSRAADTPDVPDPENARRFESTMRRVLSVSKEELTKREAAYQERRREKKNTPRKTT